MKMNHFFFQSVVLLFNDEYSNFVMEHFPSHSAGILVFVDNLFNFLANFSYKFNFIIHYNLISSRVINEINFLIIMSPGLNNLMIIYLYISQCV